MKIETFLCHGDNNVLSEEEFLQVHGHDHEEKYYVDMTEAKIGNPDDEIEPGEIDSLKTDLKDMLITVRGLTEEEAQKVLETEFTTEILEESLRPKTREENYGI